MAAMEKVYPCLVCKQDIRLERKDNHWVKWNLDGTAHVDQQKKQKQQQPQQQQQSPAADLTKKEIAAIRAELQVIVMKLEALEKKK
jgi:hypothetical protein